MEYHLVLQFPGISLDDYDTLVAMEEKLIQQLCNLGVVDGHDLGSGEMNIFIITNDPVKAFDCVKPIIISHNLLPVLKAAYRKIEEQKFQILWPVQLKNFRIT
jgi:hypothetical protein